jgi:hypothetical protein
VEGSGRFTLDNILFEGSPAKRISVEYKTGAANYFYATLRDITWGGEQDYLLYAEDDTDLRNWVFDGRHFQSAYSGSYGGVSVYNAHMCDFRGLGYFQGDVMDITVRNLSAGCLYRLGPDDTVTFSSQNIGSIIEDQLTETTGNLKLESDLELGNGYYYSGHLRIGTYHIWVDSTGDLRIKDGAPSSDTDGTIVGTQS